jgi:hypothetical membrane protein
MLAGSTLPANRGGSLKPAARTGTLGPVIAKLAVVAPPVFFLVMLALGAVTPGYNALAQMGSELSLAPLGWVMIANFIALGLTEFAFGVSLFRAIGPSWSGRLGAAMVTLVGIAFLDAGVFVTDPPGTAVTTHGVLHVLAAVTLFFISIPIGAAAIAWRFRSDRRYAIYSALSAVASPVLLVATFLSGDLTGLTERVLIAMALAWLSVLALRLAPGTIRPGTDAGMQPGADGRSDPARDTAIEANRVASPG